MNSLSGSCNFAIRLYCSNPTLFTIKYTYQPIKSQNLSVKIISKVLPQHFDWSTQLLLLKADLNAL